MFVLDLGAALDTVEHNSLLQDYRKKKKKIRRSPSRKCTVKDLFCVHAIQLAHLLRKHGVDF